MLMWSLYIVVHTCVDEFLLRNRIILATFSFNLFFQFSHLEANKSKLIMILNTKNRHAVPFLRTHMIWTPKIFPHFHSIVQQFMQHTTQSSITKTFNSNKIIHKTHKNFSGWQWNNSKRKVFITMHHTFRPFIIYVETYTYRTYIFSQSKKCKEEKKSTKKI